MMQSILSLILLGGTGVALLGGCLLQASGPAAVLMTVVTVFFGVGFFAHLRSLNSQG